MAGIGKNTKGKDFNFFQKKSVSNTTFGTSSDGYYPDMIIAFQNNGITFLNEGSGVVEYSFNGNTVHGELDSANTTKTLSFSNRQVSRIWFRVKSGSSGPIIVSVSAW